MNNYNISCSNFGWSRSGLRWVLPHFRFSEFQSIKNQILDLIQGMKIDSIHISSFQRQDLWGSHLCDNPIAHEQNKIFNDVHAFLEQDYYNSVALLFYVSTSEVTFKIFVQDKQRYIRFEVYDQSNDSQFERQFVRLFDNPHWSRKLMTQDDMYEYEKKRQRKMIKKLYGDTFTFFYLKSLGDF